MLWLDSFCHFIIVSVWSNIGSSSSNVDAALQRALQAMYKQEPAGYVSMGTGAPAATALAGAVVSAAASPTALRSGRRCVKCSRTM